MWIGGRFELRALLATDRHGEVWAATDREGRAVRLRFVEPLSEAAQSRLRARRPKHPLLEPPPSFGPHDDGRFWIATSAFAGETLEERLSRAGPLSRKEVLSLVRELAVALGVLHARGLCHGRLDASRIVLSPEGPRLIDTSLNLLDDPADRATLPRLSTEIAWLAPEVAAGECAPNPETDVWALGLVASRALRGSSPFRARTRATLLVETALSKPSLPEDALGDLLASCLSREPVLRPTARELLGRLEDIDPRPTRRRHPVVLAAVTFAFFALGTRPRTQPTRVVTGAPIVLVTPTTQNTPVLELEPDPEPPPKQEMAVEAKPRSKPGKGPEPFHGVTSPGF